MRGYKSLGTTKCIVHSGLAVKSGSAALIGLRQICRFDYFKGGKFGSLGLNSFKNN
jgi:hypothetical protein